jgi:hypothetical protein
MAKGGGRLRGECTDEAQSVEMCTSIEFLNACYVVVAFTVAFETVT